MDRGQLKGDGGRGLLLERLITEVLIESERTNEILYKMFEFIQPEVDYKKMTEEELRGVIKLKILPHKRPQGWAVQSKDKLIEILERKE